MPDATTLTKPCPNPDRVRVGSDPDHLTAPLRGGSGVGGPRPGRGVGVPGPSDQGQGSGGGPAAQGPIGGGRMTEGSGEGERLWSSPTRPSALHRLPSPETPRSEALAPELPPSLEASIERVVEREGGDRTDALDLAEVWVRALRDSDRRAGGIRAAVRVRRCSCADGGEAGREGRCERCWGVLAIGPDPDQLTGGAGS
jgi:hypothetical protein